MMALTLPFLSKVVLFDILRIGAWINPEVPSRSLNFMRNGIDPIFILSVWISMKHPFIVITRVARAPLVPSLTVRIESVVRFDVTQTLESHAFVFRVFLLLLTIIAN
jgi:hypothetical protein